MTKVWIVGGYYDTKSRLICLPGTEWRLGDTFRTALGAYWVIRARTENGTLLAW